MKFKVGDKVKLVDRNTDSCIARYVFGLIGTITLIEDDGLPYRIDVNSERGWIWAQDDDLELDKSRSTVVGKAFHESEMAKKDEEISQLRIDAESHKKGFVAQSDKCNNMEQELLIANRDLERSEIAHDHALEQVKSCRSNITRLNRIIDAIIK